MGASGRQLKRFLSEHPKCCFCGGGASATTIDHIPPRAMFSDRCWPEGYAFPACGKCNSRTSNVEQVVSLYAWLPQQNPSPSARKQFRNLADGVRNNFPEMMPSPVLSANKKRAFLRERGMRLPETSTTDDIKLVDFPRATFDKMVPVACKLFCAIYYRELGKIFPATGSIQTTLTTTAYISPDQMTWFLRNLPNGRVTKRANRDITKEFAYRYEAGENDSVLGVLAHLKGHLIWYLGGVADRTLIGADQRKDWCDIFGRPLTTEEFIS